MSTTPAEPPASSASSASSAAAALAAVAAAATTAAAAPAPAAPAPAAAAPVSSAAAAQQQLQQLQARQRLFDQAKQQLFDLLLSDLERSLSELYTLCEFEGREKWVEDAWGLLVESGSSFGEVRKAARREQTEGEAAPVRAPARPHTFR